MTAPDPLHTNYSGFCLACDEPWPCYPQRVAELEAEVARLVRVHNVDWAASLNGAKERTELEAELRNEMMERSDAERAAEELRTENTRLREALDYIAHNGGTLNRGAMRQVARAALAHASDTEETT